MSWQFYSTYCPIIINHLWVWCAIQSLVAACDLICDSKETSSRKVGLCSRSTWLRGRNYVKLWMPLTQWRQDFPNVFAHVVVYLLFLNASQVVIRSLLQQYTQIMAMSKSDFSGSQSFPPRRALATTNWEADKSNVYGTELNQIFRRSIDIRKNIHVTIGLTPLMLLTFQFHFRSQFRRYSQIASHQKFSYFPTFWIRPRNYISRI